MTDWKLPKNKINNLQQDSITKLVALCKQAHFTNVHVRVNGEWREFEADWIKNMTQSCKHMQNQLQNKPCPVSQPGGSNQACTCSPKQQLIDRITDYLASGGLFNPESVCPQSAVRDLIIDFRNYLRTTP